MKIVITVEVPDGATVAVGAPDTAAVPSTPATPAKARASKATAAPPSAPPAAPPAAAAATAPAAAAPAAEAPTLPANFLKDVLNPKVAKLAGLDRDVALKILLNHGASTQKTSTSQLKPEVYQVVLDETEEAIDKIEAAAVQVANSGSLI